MKIRILLPALLLLLVSVASAQSDADREEAHNLLVQGVAEADQGNYDNALKLYAQANTLDPGNPIYAYETAYVYYAQSNYKKTIALIEPIIDNEHAEDVYFQLLGNSYDILGDSVKAIAMYDAGLKRFPGSGPLHLERGLMALRISDYDGAVGYWENGIEAAPTYPSNYYWAAKMYCASKEKLWGLLYGEIFMNLERNSKRTAEISKLLFDTYASVVKVNGNKIAITLSENQSIKAPPGGEKVDIPMSMRYEMTLGLVATAALTTGKEKGWTLNRMDSMRTNFCELWHEQGLDTLYNNPLFTWQQQLRDSGYFSAYNHWLLSQGADKEMEKWYAANKEGFDQFMNWFAENSIPIDARHYFIRPR
jgi:tetratricopeptide (TPR) repeat protein